MKRSSLRVIFSLAGGALLVFILLPVAAALFSTSAGALAGALNDRELSASVRLTFGAAGAATLLGVVGGVPLAYLLARSKFRGKALVEAIVDLPIVIPHTAAGIALLLVFGRQGWLGKPLSLLGVTFTDNFAGVVAAMSFVSLPFLVNLSREAFAGVDAEMERTALIDGATPWQAFWWVTMPLAWRGVLSGMLMMWARGISEFGAVVILAYHPKIVPVLVFERFQGYGLSAAQPAAMVLILAALLVFGLLRFWLNRQRD